MNQHLAYGFWPSSITPKKLTQQSSKRSEPRLWGSDVFWLESRPLEGGRNALVRRRATGETDDILAAPHSLRTRAQEYGGGHYCLSQLGIFLVLDADQRVYRFDWGTRQLQAISPENSGEISYRFADFCVDDKQKRLFAIRETHRVSIHHPSTDLVCFHLDDHGNSKGEPQIVASGADFYATPRLSPQGTQLTYLSWNHPNMPWDGTECHLVTLNPKGEPLFDEIIAGGKEESIFQPEWSPAGELFYVSDKTGWWNLYKHGASTPLIDIPAEFATPQWVFGMSTYGFLNADTIFCCYTQNGQWQLGKIQISNSALETLDNNFSDISNVTANNNQAVFIAGNPQHSQTLFIFKNDSIEPIQNIEYDSHASQPTAIEFPTSDGETAFGFFYTPNASAEMPLSKTGASKQLPPLIVMAHGGPTGATETTLNYKIQFWTSRGFAVLDVNYRGSTGYGTRYRNRLRNNWGITDVIDVCSGVQHLISLGRVNPNACFIRGSSAGGFTVLAALTFTHQFAAGTSLYGIGDLTALAEDTHKFEAHYLDSLVGPYPQEKSLYLERSPINHIEKLNKPVLFLQGLKDKVVPPSQAEAMFTALKTKGIKTDYINFENEGHGFRQADSMIKAIESELAFYQSILEENN